MGKETTSVLHSTYIGLCSSLFHLPYFKASIWHLLPRQSLHALQTQMPKMTETVLEHDIQNIMRRGEEKKLKGRKNQPAQQTAFKSLSSSLIPLFSLFCLALSVLFLSSSLSYKSPAPLVSVQMMIWHCPGLLCCQLSKKKKACKNPVVRQRQSMWLRTVCTAVC